ncbi:LLM class F420-dependent oxidoreductase, partial [Nonomuraea fuscirosea]
MRYGYFLSEPQGADAIGGLRDQIAQAADEGFSSAWLSHIFGLDAITALTAAGVQAPPIELGTAVV